MQHLWALWRLSTLLQLIQDSFHEPWQKFFDSNRRRHKRLKTPTKHGVSDLYITSGCGHLISWYIMCNHHFYAIKLWRLFLQPVDYCIVTRRWVWRCPVRSAANFDMTRLSLGISLGKNNHLASLSRSIYIMKVKPLKLKLASSSYHVDIPSSLGYALPCHRCLDNCSANWRHLLQTCWRQGRGFQRQRNPNHWCDEGEKSVCMGVSKNSGTPKSSISIGFSIINHPFWGTPIFGNTQVCMEVLAVTWALPFTPKISGQERSLILANICYKINRPIGSNIGL